MMMHSKSGVDGAFAHEHGLRLEAAFCIALHCVALLALITVTVYLGLMIMALLSRDTLRVRLRCGVGSGFV